METAVRKLQLGLDAGGTHDTPPIELIREVVEQGALADPGLASKYDDPAPTVERVRQRCIKKRALGTSSKQFHGPACLR
jgi:hypothetical protein